jgi:hypothetical protein
MEAAFGVDFGGVRVHADTEADTLNRSLNARAFTTGQDIYFRQGGYSPGSSSGRELIAHELVHVVQQTGAVQRKRTVSQPGDRSEQAADLMAHLVMRQEQQTTPGTEEDRQPTEAEKAAALAAAQAAEHMADQAAATGKAAVEKSRAAEATESEAEQAAAQDVAAAQTAGAMAVAEAEAPPAEAEEAEQSASEEAAPAPVAGAGPVVGVAGLEDKAPTSPDADPTFQAVLATIQAVAVSQQAHAPATTKAAEAQAAAVAPPSEVTGRAQANQVGEMEAMETPEFDAAAFKAELMKRIAALAPKTTAEADNFKRDNQLGSVKAEMQGQVAQEQTATQTPLEEKTAQAPDTSQIEPKPVTPLPPGHPGAPPPDVGAAQAVPKLKGHSEVEAPLHANSQKLDQQMAEADITEEQLATSNEPTFTAALGAKRTAQAHAAAAPQPYRQFEQEQLGQAEAEAVAMALDQTQAMHGSRAELLHQVEAQQGQAKSKDEQAREKVAADIQAMYDTTKTRVDTILSDLDGKVAQAFDTGAAAAKKAFEDYVAAKMEAYKKRRYGGWLGWARWAKDKLLGMPAAVNAFYQQGRQLFLDKMNAVLDNVVAIIGTGLTAAKAEIAQGKQHIQNYLDQLPTNLQAVGQQAAQDIQGQFEALEQSVNDKQHELIDNLANKYRENLQAVDARIEELKAANQGLVDKAINAVVGVIKTILKLKEMLTRVLAKVAGVVGLILRDPIGFLGNLVSGLKQGFENFVGNILSHLQTGLIGWLTGTLGPMGVQLPEDLFSVQGIFSLVMQVLGLTWDYIRQKAVKLLGEPVVKALETGFAPFQILLKEGPAGLWQYVKEQFQDL